MGNNAIKTIINCGTTQVSVSIFSERDGTLVLEKLAVQNLLYDYTSESEWDLAASAALSSIFSTLKPKGEIVAIAPGQFLLTKSVHVTHVEPERYQQMIAFEAQSSFPFPLEELVWDSQIISSDGIEDDVVLFALKRSNAIRFTQLMIGAGVKPTSIQPATNLDVRAYRYRMRNDPDSGAPVLIVNVGAHTTNLSFVNENGFGISNVSVGGNFVTQKLAESTGLPLQGAEQKKIAFFSGALKLAEGDPLAATILDAGEAFSRRLSQEITRRVVLFKRSNKGVGPAKILVSGRGSLLPGLTEKLSELQHVPVEVLDMSDAIALGALVRESEVQDAKFELQEVVGEAASLVMPDVAALNLMPQEIAAGIDFEKKVPFLIAAGILLAVAPWPVFAHFGDVENSLNAEAKAQTAVINSLKARQEKITEAEKETNKIRNRVEAVNGVLNDRYAWNNFLAEIQTKISALQASNGIDEDTDEPKFRDDRHVWIERIRIARNKVAGTDDAPAKVNCDAEITFKMLILSVNGNAPEHDAKAFNQRREVILNALNETGLFEKKVREDRMDWSKPNMPTLTVNFRLKSDKGI